MNQDEEIWYDIDELPYHQISDKKRVRRLEHTITVEHTVKPTIYEPTERGYVAMYQSHPKKQFFRSIELLYKKYVLKEDVTPKSNAHRKKRKLQF